MEPSKNYHDFYPLLILQEDSHKICSVILRRNVVNNISNFMTSCEPFLDSQPQGIKGRFKLNLAFMLNIN